MNTNKSLVAVCVLSCLLLPAAVAPVEAASFQGLGDLPGGEFYSKVDGISADGSTVVGFSCFGSAPSGDPLYEAFRWTEAEAMVGLGDLSGGLSRSHARAVSADGSVVVGNARTERSGSNQHEGLRWTQSDGNVRLGDLGGDYFSDATDVSADGSVVVGWDVTSPVGQGNQTVEAYRWTAAEGMVGLGFLPDERHECGTYDPWSRAKGVSADGSVVVGYVGYCSGERMEAFRWAPQTGMVAMEVPPSDLAIPDRPDPITGIEYMNSLAHAVSADGSVIVGGIEFHIDYAGGWSNDTFPFRWTESEGYVRLGSVPGYLLHQHYPMDVSADGSVIVGMISTEFGREGFIWDEVHGARSLREALIDEYGLGPQLAGWNLGLDRGVTGIAISDDGTTIVGEGINPDGNQEAWRAVIPEPSSFVLLLTGTAGLFVWRRRRRTSAA